MTPVCIIVSKVTKTLFLTIHNLQYYREKTLACECDENS